MQLLAVIMPGLIALVAAQSTAAVCPIDAEGWEDTAIQSTIRAGIKELHGKCMCKSDFLPNETLCWRVYWPNFSAIYLCNANTAYAIAIPCNTVADYAQISLDSCQSMTDFDYVETTAGTVYDSDSWHVWVIGDTCQPFEAQLPMMERRNRPNNLNE
ncbi:hypothetical protein PG994_005073 [Apiospora phragmitis]|uniref:Cyanovirin-N domain-containing protein n=1 Tax=Apiospora phragmitis TaxID=2905665 RepID=A0ABR1VSD6_9PEZI